MRLAGGTLVVDGVSITERYWDEPAVKFGAEKRYLMPAKVCASGLAMLPVNAGDFIEVTEDGRLARASSGPSRSYIDELIALGTPENVEKYLATLPTPQAREIGRFLITKSGFRQVTPGRGKRILPDESKRWIEGKGMGK